MSPTARLAGLRQRQQELLLDSEVQRRLVAAECAGLRERLQWFESAVGVARLAMPLGALLLPLWRWWSGRRQGRPAGAGPSWPEKISRAITLAQQFARLWQQLR